MPAAAELRTVASQLELLGTDVCFGAEAERDHALVAERAELAGQPAAVGVVRVERRRRRVVGHEQAALRLEVLLERPVEVQVVAAEVREGERREADSREPSELRAVRRGLHRAAPVAHVEHLPQCPLHVDRLRRRAQGGPPLAADAALDRAEQARPPSGGGEDREQRGSTSSSCRSCR